MKSISTKSGWQHRSPSKRCGDLQRNKVGKKTKWVRGSLRNGQFGSFQLEKKPGKKWKTNIKQIFLNKIKFKLTMDDHRLQHGWSGYFQQLAWVLLWSLDQLERSMGTNCCQFHLKKTEKPKILSRIFHQVLILLPLPPLNKIWTFSPELSKLSANLVNSSYPCTWYSFTILDDVVENDFLITPNRGKFCLKSDDKRSASFNRKNRLKN